MLAHRRVAAVMPGFPMDPLFTESFGGGLAFLKSGENSHLCKVVRNANSFEDCASAKFLIWLQGFMNILNFNLGTATI